jgi:hypothetical protein
MADDYTFFEERTTSACTVIPRKEAAKIDVQDGIDGSAYSLTLKMEAVSFLQICEPESRLTTLSIFRA